jgi:hypothetical protein
MQEPTQDALQKKTSNGQVNFQNQETREEKMARKRRSREMWYKSTPEPFIMANLSKNHQDYGMSPAEHLRAKQERAENNS